MPLRPNYDGQSGESDKSCPRGHPTCCGAADLHGAAVPERAQPARLVNAAKSPENSQLSVVGALLLRKDLVLITSGGKQPRQPQTVPNKRAIEFLSWRSLRSMALRAVNTPSDWQSLLLVTYPREWPTDGRQVKQDLNRLLDAFRYRYPRLRYLWFLEFQGRGAPHFHMLTDVPVPEPRVWKKRPGHTPAQINEEQDAWLKEAWRRAIQIGGTNAHGPLITGLDVIREVDGGARYAVSYAQKPKQKQVPKAFHRVGRFWSSDQATSALAVEKVRISAGELQKAGIQLSLSAWGDPHKVQFGQAERLREYLAQRAPWIRRHVSDQFHRREMGRDCPCAACTLEREVSDHRRLIDDRTASLFGPC